MIKYGILIALLFSMLGCMKAKHADLVIHNAKIHSMDEKMHVFEAMAIVNGKVVELGPEREILNAYSADKFINAEKKEIYPGLHDAHGHMMSYAKQLLICDLVGTTSYYQMLTRLEKFAQKGNSKVIQGRGWDQSLWGETLLPNNALLNKTFPNTPVVCTRVDGHAMLANQKALELAGFTKDTKISGGEIIIENGEMTGLILDNAIDEMKIFLPQPEKEDLKKALLEVQKEMIAFGITNIHEAGVNMDEFKLFDELATENKLKLNVYLMLYPSEKSLAFIEKNGHYKNNNLTVRSIKIVGDGSLGSRGACLLHNYNDHDSKGFLLTDLKEIERIAVFAKKNNYQLNTHCIGDSTNRNLLKLIDTLMNKNEDHRWRIEHAQILDTNDFQLFNSSNVIPSVQPTHAVSDQRWAENRIGKERMKGAYAYNSLLNQRGLIVFGTDFPVEKIDPFLTIHAAVNRKNIENEPTGGYLTDEAVTFDNCMRAMTIWAAMARFEENTSGSLEKNKDATFVILDNLLGEGKVYKPNYAWKTFNKGIAIFEMD